ncbi:uncharacterized protein CXorf58 homolog [Bombina bombina]|uniref:uncharacterized protein CXorf58 homolog n=1 Tax=Bombina bombina TaxID=8345 RepID=UPI00235AAEA4|nr:uncharacterized protein CXorf58 homolog [Bombina bombina]
MALNSKSSATISVSLPSISAASLPTKDYVRDRKLDTTHVINNGDAAIRIQRTWRCHRNRKLFKLLKHTARAAETHATYAILRKVCPLEAELLRDPGMQCKVRFRFAGCEFPPFIVFKIFHHSRGCGSRYISGKRVISPSSEAASDACKMMGHRAYYDQMICDELDYQKNRITDIMDVATLKDYMQYISYLDETPAHFGGRDNCWRRLSLKSLPRTTIMYDIVDYAESGTLSDRLKHDMKLLLQIPRTEDVQLRQLSAVTQVRSLAPPPSPSSAVSSHQASQYTAALKHSARRSQKARLKVAKMRRLYGLEKQMDEHSVDTTHAYSSQFSGRKHTMDAALSDEDWDEEAQKLYAWSQGLSLDDTEIQSPLLIH